MADGLSVRQTCTHPMPFPTEAHDPDSRPAGQPSSCCGHGSADCSNHAAVTSAGEGASQPRQRVLARGLRLEYLTVGWNVVEGVVSVAAAVAAGSVALLGFGIDSFVETTSALILIWRLRAETRSRADAAEIARLDQRAHKLVGLSLFALAAYIVFDAAKALITADRPEPTLVGIVITALSLTSMGWLARAKRRTARELKSRALEADSFQTTACFWLSLITLVGIGLNAVLGWWWADPAAALAMTYFVVAEGRQAWRGEDCGCSGACG
jgi:divalent metal cation (Fe/Co/Zn/Cd) transporter